MNSKFDSFLENDDRYKLFIYEMLQSRLDGIVSGELKKQVELSDFKFNQLVDELKAELQEMKSKIIVDNKFIIGKDFSSNDYQLLQLMYFKKSVAADFLIKVGLLATISRSEFADVHFMSEASVYNLQADINNIISDYGLKFKNSRIIGNERDVRSFYFQLLFNYYGGIEVPFPDRTKQLIMQEVNQIDKTIAPDLTTLQKAQLIVFLGVQISRIRNNQYIENLNEEIFEAENFLEILKSQFSLRDIPISEGEYLYLYLVFNELIDSDLHLQKTSLETKLVKYFDKKLKITKLKSFSEMKGGIRILTHKWSYFRITTTTFISDEQLVFFKQSYPILHEVVYNFIDNLKKIDDYQISSLEKNHMYFELMFFLLSFNEVKHNEQTINICVDFSGGKKYNKFISENIEYFRYLNVCLQNELNENVDIYISDFSNSQVTCEQIVWKSPPMDNDWEKFANLVVSLKGQKNE